MTKRFLGWDCANKTLAWSYLDIDTHIYSKISMLIDSAQELFHDYIGDNADGETFSLCVQDPEFLDMFAFILDCMLYFTGNFLNYISVGVVDLLDGAKVHDTSLIDRTYALHRFLSTHEHVCRNKIDQYTQPIIELQPPKIGSSTNSQSTVISHQLAFYYIDNLPIMVSPKLKNKIAFDSDLTFERFLREEIPKRKNKKDASYSARKIHSKVNFMYLLSILDLDYITNGIPRAVLDDLADSTMQILAYLVENKLFL